MSYKDRHWHEFCFKCCECQKSLVDQPFAPKNDNIYCSDCHDKNFAARCDGCGEPFRGGKYCFRKTKLPFIFIKTLWFIWVFLTHILERKLTCKKNNYQYIYMCKYVWDGLILRFKDLVFQGLDRLYEIYWRVWLLCTLIIGFIQGVNGTKIKHFMW